jgi:ABC-type transport system involved in cytochrome c biogenesis permease subunit
VGLGKIFLAASLLATGLAGVLLLARLKPFTSLLSTTAEQTLLDTLAWRIMALAFVFHSLMLIAGAVWAQDAWGRYWAWDSLETSTFITWLVLGISLHLRVTWRLPHWLGWWLIVLVFALAFLTFLGLPFSSLGPHKGML